jgi:hypothetical protein
MTGVTVAEVKNLIDQIILRDIYHFGITLVRL